MSRNKKSNKMENNNQSQNPTNTKTISMIISIIVIAISIWYFYGGGVERGIATDEIKQYEMCIRNNDFIGASAHAGIASAAFQQAGDEDGYRKWKSLADDAMEKATNIEMDKYK
jgi:preprotein translocase subunit SecF